MGFAMSDLKIISPGLLTTIQDLGRYSYRSQGVPVSGAMDQAAAKLANTLVGNDESDALLECTMMGPKIEFLCDTYIAVTGAEVEVKIDGNPLNINQTIAITSGSILQFGRLHSRCRFYISFASGIDAPLTLGSRSTDTISNIGPKIIQRGDKLKLIDKDKRSLLVDYITLSKSTSNEIIVYPGPEYHIIRDIDLGNLSFNIDPASNRMAYLLHCDMKLSHSYEMISSGVLPGTIQLTPSGQLNVLMRDAQTTGGYPRVLQVAEDSINLISQLKGREKLNFKLEFY